MKRNIVLRAPVFSLSGYGEHSRDIALSLLKDERFNVSVIPTGWGGSSTGEHFDESVLSSLVFGCNNKIRERSTFIFIHVGIPTEFEHVGAFNVGITAGLESTRISQKWVEGCNKMDLVIVPTKFASDTFMREGVTKPIIVVPEGVDINTFNDVVSEEEDSIILDTKFNFLSIGQWINSPFGKDRKQIGLLIDTFLKAFHDDPDVGLVLKTYTNNISSPDRFITKSKIEQIRNGRKDPKIYLLHGELTIEEMASLYRHPKIHAYVSLTSGEGWNRPTAEAVCCGLPIAITGWSGHMDYLNEHNATLINYNFVEVPPEVVQNGEIFERGMRWAMVDVNDAVNKMVEMRHNYINLKTRATDNAVSMQEKYNKEKVYKELNDTLMKIVFEDEDKIPDITHNQI